MTELMKKLNYKDQTMVLLKGLPENLAGIGSDFAAVAQVSTQIETGRKVTFSLIFVKDCAELESIAESSVRAQEDDSVLWFAYPKQTSKKYKTDINRDRGWDGLEQLEYRPVRQVAIDDDWSALRFRHRSKVK